MLYLKRENIATPSRYIFVFANEVSNKNYIKISVPVYNKSTPVKLYTQTSPWNIPSPLASKYFAGPARARYETNNGSPKDIFDIAHASLPTRALTLIKILHKTRGFSKKIT